MAIFGAFSNPASDLKELEKYKIFDPTCFLIKYQSMYDALMKEKQKYNYLSEAKQLFVNDYEYACYFVQVTVDSVREHCNLTALRLDDRLDSDGNASPGLLAVYNNALELMASAKDLENRIPRGESESYFKSAVPGHIHMINTHVAAIATIARLVGENVKRAKEGRTAGTGRRKAEGRADREIAELKARLARYEQDLDDTKSPTKAPPERAEAGRTRRADEVLQSEPIGNILRALQQRASEFDAALVGDASFQKACVGFFGELRETFEKHGITPPDQMLHIERDAVRIHQTEAIIDLWMEKIARAGEDTRFSEELRERKIETLTRLMEREIEALEGVG